MSPTVFVIDDDPPVRHALTRLVEGEGLAVRAFESAEEFLAVPIEQERGCILLDVRLPGVTGPELQTQLNSRNIKLPIIFLTAHGSVPTSVKALRSGAFDFLEKPVEGRLLLDSVHAALKVDAQRRATETERQRVKQRFERLTTRERDVMWLVVEGHSNKEVGRRLDISHRTVEIHRGHMMQKMRANTLLALADFVRLLEIEPPRTTVAGAADSDGTAPTELDRRP